MFNFAFDGLGLGMIVADYAGGKKERTRIMGQRANVPSPKPRLNAERHATYSPHLIRSQRVECARARAGRLFISLPPFVSFSSESS